MRRPVMACLATTGVLALAVACSSPAMAAASATVQGGASAPAGSVWTVRLSFAPDVQDGTVTYLASDLTGSVRSTDSTPRAARSEHYYKWRIISSKLTKKSTSKPTWEGVCNYQIKNSPDSCSFSVSVTSENDITKGLEVTVGTLINWFEAEIGISLSEGVGHSFSETIGWTWNNIRKRKLIGYMGYVHDSFKYKITQELWECTSDHGPKYCDRGWTAWGPWTGSNGKHKYSYVNVTDNQIYGPAFYRCKHVDHKTPETPCAPGTG